MSKRSARKVDVAMDRSMQPKDSFQFSHSRFAADISDDDAKKNHTCLVGTCKQNRDSCSLLLWLLPLLLPAQLLLILMKASIALLMGRYNLQHIAVMHLCMEKLFAILFVDGTLTSWFMRLPAKPIQRLPLKRAILY